MRSRLAPSPANHARSDVSESYGRCQRNETGCLMEWSLCLLSRVTLSSTRCGCKKPGCQGLCFLKPFGNDLQKRARHAIRMPRGRKKKKPSACMYRFSLFGEEADGAFHPVLDRCIEGLSVVMPPGRHCRQCLPPLCLCLVPQLGC